MTLASPKGRVRPYMLPIDFPHPLTYTQNKASAVAAVLRRHPK